jgi:hypothetical protein
VNGANPVLDLFRKMRDATRLAGLVAFLRLLLLLALANPTAATDRTLCFQLPGELRPRPGARRAATYPNSTADRCVTRALWDIQAASMHRVRGADDAGADATALRCVPAQEAFLCDRRLGDPNELFVCELTDAGPGSLTKAMDACVWPVCEQICASRPPGAERADDWEMTRACGRCERACHAKGFRPETSAGQNSPGGRFCAGIAAYDAGGGDAETRARAAYAYALGGWTGGWSGISAAATGASTAAATAAAAASATAATAAAASTTAAATATAASTAAVATTAALTGNFFVVSARVALLFAAFKSALQHFIVVAPPGFGWNPVPNRPGGHPNPGTHPGWPPIPPAPTWKVPPPYSWAPSPPPSTSAKPPPPPPPPVGGQCPGVADPAFTCVGECGLCIFFPGEEDPNCCCDGECLDFGDCCLDFEACCPAGTFAAKHAFDASALGKRSVFSGRKRGSSFGGARKVSGRPSDGVRTVSGSPSGGETAARLAPRDANVGARRAKEGGFARVAARSARILDLD